MYWLIIYSKKIYLNKYFILIIYKYIYIYVTYFEKAEILEKYGDSKCTCFYWDLKFGLKGYAIAITSAHFIHLWEKKQKKKRIFTENIVE